MFCGGYKNQMMGCLSIWVWVWYVSTSTAQVMATGLSDTADVKSSKAFLRTVQKIQTSGQAHERVKNLVDAQVMKSFQNPAKVAMDHRDSMKKTVSAEAVNVNKDSPRQLSSSTGNKNNFVNMDIYDNIECSGLPIAAHGFLLNYCFEKEDETSYLLKTNTHEGTLVQLDYDNEHCNGMPSHVTDLFKEMHTTNYDECGYGIVYSYLDEYPKYYYRDALVATYSDEESCNEKNKYYAYQLMASDYCFGGSMFHTHNCGSTGEFIVRIFNDEACTELVSSESYPALKCGEISYDDDYYEDDDSDDHDDPFELDDAYLGYVCAKADPSM